MLHLNNIIVTGLKVFFFFAEHDVAKHTKRQYRPTVKTDLRSIVNISVVIFREVYFSISTACTVRHIYTFIHICVRNHLTYIYLCTSL